MSTLGDTMRTLRGIMSTSGGYHEYIGGILLVHRWDTMSTLGGYHEYTGGISWVHRGISWVHRRDTISTSVRYHEYIGGYHEYIGGISWVHRGMFSTLGFSTEIERFLPTCSPTCIMISPRCTHGIPPMYWTPPDVLMISPQCTHGMPPMYWTCPDVLNTHYTGCLYWETSPPGKTGRSVWYQLLFCRYSCVLYFPRNKSTMVLQTFEYIFECKVRIK